jgi:hypothetical protein
VRARCLSESSSLLDHSHIQPLAAEAREHGTTSKKRALREHLEAASASRLAVHIGPDEVEVEPLLAFAEPATCTHGGA